MHLWMGRNVKNKDIGNVMFIEKKQVVKFPFREDNLRRVERVFVQEREEEADVVNQNKCKWEDNELPGKRSEMKKKLIVSEEDGAEGAKIYPKLGKEEGIVRIIEWCKINVDLGINNGE
jgi:hypothetical protein